jgi:hypothetical protein
MAADRDELLRKLRDLFGQMPGAQTGSIDPGTPADYAPIAKAIATDFSPERARQDAER